MPICGTGIDLAENGRFQKMLENKNSAFFARVFTIAEREYCERFKTTRAKAERYAARFAAKEAFSKALGTGFRQMNWHDIEVQNDSLGAPFLVLSGKAAELIKAKGVYKVHLSLSHADGYSVALVVAEGKEKE